MMALIIMRSNIRKTKGFENKANTYKSRAGHR